MYIKYAGIVYKDNDIQVIEEIINKMETYGVSEVAKAFGKISSRAADNPKRSYRYVVGILGRLLYYILFLGHKNGKIYKFYLIYLIKWIKVSL